MDGSGQGAVALAVALRDAHFKLKSLARAWEERASLGTVRSRESLGPVWQYSDDPDQVSYSDGQLPHRRISHAGSGWALRFGEYRPKLWAPRPIETRERRQAADGACQPPCGARVRSSCQVDGPTIPSAVIPPCCWSEVTACWV